jgi:tRNA threonylcarbamoyladenosine biosynthesis protein TsaE
MITKSPEETIELALKFTKTLKGGEVLAMSGDLGSGKTTFMKGLAEGLKVNETITSPTFVLLKSYPGKISPPAGGNKIELVHVDAYRTDSIEDIKSVGIEDFFNRDDVILAIEWAEKIEEILPKNTKWINFKYKNEKEREIDFDTTNKHN